MNPARPFSCVKLANTQHSCQESLASESKNYSVHRMQRRNDEAEELGWQSSDFGIIQHRRSTASGDERINSVGYRENYGLPPHMSKIAMSG